MLVYIAVSCRGLRWSAADFDSLWWFTVVCSNFLLFVVVCNDSGQFRVSLQQFEAVCDGLRQFARVKKFARC